MGTLSAPLVCVVCLKCKYIEVNVPSGHHTKSPSIHYLLSRIRQLVMVIPRSEEYSNALQSSQEELNQEIIPVVESKQASGSSVELKATFRKPSQISQTHI